MRLVLALGGTLLLLAGCTAAAPAAPVATRAPVSTRQVIQGHVPAATAATATPAAPAPCADAPQKTQAYRPTPRSGTIQENLARTFASQARASAIQVAGWDAADNGVTCTVALTYTENGQPRTLGWLYNPRTGHVDAVDAWTQQSSGFP